MSQDSSNGNSTPEFPIDPFIIMLLARFPLGSIVVTGSLMDAVSYADAMTGLRRHSQCDWGECTKGDAESNDLALAEEARIFSVYRSSEGRTFWIITEADRSATTILLPEDY